MDEKNTKEIHNFISEIYLYEDKIERELIGIDVSSEQFNYDLHRRRIYTEQLFLKSAKLLKTSFQEIEQKNIKVIKSLKISSLFGSEHVLQTIPQMIEEFISIYIQTTKSNKDSDFKIACSEMNDWTRRIQVEKLRPHISSILSYLLLIHKDVELNEALFA